MNPCFLAEITCKILISFKNVAYPRFTQPTMPRFAVKQSAKLNLTSYSGLALVGQCCAGIASSRRR